MTKAEDDRVIDLITSGKVEVNIVTINPGVASAILKMNTQNRKPVDRQVRHLTKELMDGKWHLSNDAVVINKEGRLDNGQHRLLASVAADMPIDVILETGADPKDRIVYDTGVRRNLAQQLGMMGVARNSSVASATTLRIRWEALTGREFASIRGIMSVIGHEQSIEFVKEHPVIAQSVGSAERISRAFPVVPISASLAFMSMVLEKDTTAANEFLNAVVNGAGLEEGDPRLALRNFLARNPKGHFGAAGSQTALLLLVKGWNAWRSGKKLQVLRFSKEELIVQPL